MSGDMVRAFELYFRLTSTGVKTSAAMRQISDEVGISVRQLYVWKKQGEWDRRCVERSVELNETLSGLLKEESDEYVGDFRKPFVKILNTLVEDCFRGVNEDKVEITNVRELVSVIELSVKLQKEMQFDMPEIVSAEYSREKHVAEINKVLDRLKADSGDAKQREEARLKDEGRLQEVEVQQGG